jgi:hypothetical protein
LEQEQSDDDCQQAGQEMGPGRNRVAKDRQIKPPTGASKLFYEVHR